MQYQRPGSYGQNSEEEMEEEEIPQTQDLDDLMPSAEHQYNFHVLSPTSVSSMSPSPMHSAVAHSNAPFGGSAYFRGGPIIGKNKILIQAPPHRYDFFLMTIQVNIILHSSAGSLAHTVPMKGEMTPTSQHTGYAHYTLNWVSQWDEGMSCLEVFGI